MVDDILILLLVIGAVLLLIQWLIFTFHVKKDKYWNKLTPEEEAKVRQVIYEYLYHNPQSKMRNKYPHIANTAEATKEYELLNKLYEEGEIDEIDYNLQLEKLLDKINIEQDF